MNLPGSHPLDAQNFPVHVSKDLPNNHAVTDKPNYGQGDGCKTQTGEDNGPALDTEVCQIQARSAELQFQRTFSPVIERNLHKDQTKEVLNQATNGKIASPECMNNYKDEIKCHISCVGRPSIEHFFVNYPQLCHVISLLQNIRVKTCHPISQILQSHHDLLLKLLIILKTMFNIKRYTSSLNKIQNHDKAIIKLKIIKNFAKFCFHKNLWPRCWLKKPVKDISIKSCGKEIQLSVYFYNTEKKLNTGILKSSQKLYTAILKRCSDYSILSFQHYKQLSIHFNKLNTSIIYNVTDDTSHNRNAVLGSYSFKLRLQNTEHFQSVFHTFLILRQHIYLDRIILGYDFCKAQNVTITCSNHQVTEVTLDGNII